MLCYIILYYIPSMTFKIYMANPTIAFKYRNHHYFFLMVFDGLTMYANGFGSKKPNWKFPDAVSLDQLIFPLCSQTIREKKY